MDTNTKTYKSRYPQHTLSLNVRDKRFQVLFIGGEYLSDDVEVQKAIEALPIFHTGVIVVKSAEEIKAEAKAKADHHESLKPHREKAEKAQAAKEAAQAEKEAEDAKVAEADAKAQAELKARNDAIKSDQVARETREKKAAQARAKAEADAAVAKVQQ
jgi:hypothetical protein